MTHLIIGYELTATFVAGTAAALNDPETLEAVAQSAATAANSRVVEMMTHRFSPQGITVLAVLADSHVAVHSWPEHGWLTVDVFCCHARPMPTRGLTDSITAMTGSRLYLFAQRPRLADTPAHSSVNEHLGSSTEVAPTEGATDEGSLSSPQRWTCPVCRGTGVQAQQLSGWLSATAANRPTPERSLGQNPVNHVTNARRAAYIASRGDLHGDILVIGDDDATSIALATIGRSTRVTVVDYDTRVVEFLNEIASMGRLPLRASVRDVADEFPADMDNSVDCVVCDPIPSKDGIASFLAFATRALRRDGVVYLSAIPTDAPNPADVHAAAWAAGLVATDMIPGLSQYPGNYGTDAERPAFGEDDRRGVEFSETWIRLVRAPTADQPSEA